MLISIPSRSQSLKHYRGPFHPIQPPPPSDPTSREFIPGPFSLPRLQDHYETTIAPDLLTFFYKHRPPGYTAPDRTQRQREWVGDSPYFKNRPLRKPRGGGTLRLVDRDVTPSYIPEPTRVSIHTMVKQAISDSGALSVAGMLLQAISGVRATAHGSRTGVAPWGLRVGMNVSVTVDLYGEGMYHFLSKLVDMVLPRIKDWPGVSGGSGDSSGNISFGLTPDALSLFPEVEVNYDMYPPHMIPGCHITIHTSATNDADARILLKSLGIPFYGKYVD